MVKPRHQHDCTKCKFYGYHNDYDIYLCGTGEKEPRTLISRFGDEPEDYYSGIVFGCVTLTSGDLFVLAGGLELTEIEKQRLLQALLREHKERLKIEDYRRMPEDPEFFGTSKLFEEA